MAASVISATQFSGSGTSIGIDIPSTIYSNDLLVVCMARFDAGGTGPAYTVPSGWTDVDATSGATGGDGYASSIAAKIAVCGTDAGTTATFGTDPIELSLATLLVVRGIDTTFHEDNLAAGGFSDSWTISSGAFDGTIDGLAIDVAASRDATAVAPASGWTEHTDIKDGTYNLHFAVMSKVLTSTGAVSAHTHTFTGVFVWRSVSATFFPGSPASAPCAGRCRISHRYH